MTVRRWADYHADHLSAGANPPSGIVRRFTWSDVETFRQIKAWRDAGLSVDVINLKLVERNTEATTNAPIGVYTAGSQIEPLQPDGTPAPIMAQSIDQAVLARLVRLETVIEQGRHSQRDSTQSFALGFIAALLFMIVIVGLAVLYGGFR